MPALPDHPIKRLFAERGLPLATPPEGAPGFSRQPDDVTARGRITQDPEQLIEMRLLDSLLQLNPQLAVREETPNAAATYLAQLTEWTAVPGRPNRHLYTGEEVILILSSNVLEIQVKDPPREFTTAHNLCELNHEQTDPLPLLPLELPTVVEISERKIAGVTIPTFFAQPKPIALFPVLLGFHSGTNGSATSLPTYRYTVRDLRSNFLGEPLSPQWRSQTAGQYAQATVGAAYYDENGSLVLWHAAEANIVSSCGATQ